MEKKPCSFGSSAGSFSGVFDSIGEVNTAGDCSLISVDFFRDIFFSEVFSFGVSARSIDSFGFFSQEVNFSFSLPNMKFLEK